MIAHNRRTFLRLAMAAAAIRGAQRLEEALGYSGAAHFKYSICNELYENWDFAKVCRFSRQLGYTGLEIAPFTLGNSVDEISAARRKELRQIMKNEGIECAGLHWLLVSPKGLHITTADANTRKHSWDYMKKLIQFCHDLGGKVMVLGSPKQRGTQGGATRAQATQYLTEGLAQMGPVAQQARVLLLLEALPTDQTDVVTTLGEAVSVVKSVNQPAIQSMFDFHNTLDEKEPLDALIRKYAPYIRHVHVNEMDGRHPGTGKLDYVSAFKALTEIKYRGWISLEVFKTGYKPEAFIPEQIATEAYKYLQTVDKQMDKK
jgi:sugar phosphate isomerase/epimerase